MIDPAFDIELPLAEAVRGKAGAPEIISESVHGDCLPAAFGCVAIEQARGEVIVPIREDGGADIDGVSEDAAHGIASVIDGWRDCFDHNAASTFSGFHAGILIFQTLEVEMLRGAEQFVSEEQLRTVNRK